MGKALYKRTTVQDQIEKYRAKLIRDRIALPDTIRLYRLDDVVSHSVDDEWLDVFSTIFGALNVTALLFARPIVPFADFLVKRAPASLDRLTPRDSETKTFLHDIPFIRSATWSGNAPGNLAADIIRYLRERKAVIIEDLGVVATGGVTVEQAYIGYSSIVHTTFLKYLLDVVTDGFKLPGEREVFEAFRKSQTVPHDLGGLSFMPGPFCGGGEAIAPAACREVLYKEISRVGRYTVEKGLVDSFFGNISYFDGETIYISQTAASLDELEGHIDPVPLDYSSTAGLSASSELPAHKAIYLDGIYRAILHGHPKYSVILSMHCTEPGCDIRDCGKLCKRKRRVCGVPIVPGELGAGGLAKTVPQAMRESGICIVYGHGVFSAGRQDFSEAFQKMVDLESRCREEYFRLTST